MRATLLLSALALGPFAAAQTATDDQAQKTITEGYANFAQDAYAHWQTNSDAMAFTLSGTEKDGTITIPVYAVLYWRLSYDPRTKANTRAQAELDVYDMTQKSTPVTLRLVGDGTTLYRYDPLQHTVSTTTYGFVGTAVPGGYAGSDGPKLLAQLRAATPGIYNYLVRLVAEANVSGPAFGPAFTDWLPINPSTNRLRRTFDEVPESMRRVANPIESSYVIDPIVGNSFKRNDDPYLFFGMDAVGTNRTVTFHLADVSAAQDGSREEVKDVTVVQKGFDRTVNLLLAPVPTANLSTVAPTPVWAFVPYTGAAAARFHPVYVGGH